MPSSPGLSIGLLVAVRLASGSRVFRGRANAATPAATTDWDYVDHGASWASTPLGQCGAISGQSPIDVSQLVAGVDDGMQMFYRFKNYDGLLTMKNTGHGLEADVPSDVGNVVLGPNYLQPTTKFSIERIAVHMPSEHTFDGALADLELQLWHKDLAVGSDGQIAVVAVGFRSSLSESSAMLDALRLGGLPEHVGAETTVNTQVESVLNFYEIFGPPGCIGGVQTIGTQPAHFWQYTGSLTEPPCTGPVTWFVRAGAALPASADALSEFRHAIEIVTSPEQTVFGNTRSLQDATSRPGILRNANDAAQMPSPRTNVTFDEHYLEMEKTLSKLDSSLGVAPKRAKPEEEVDSLVISSVVKTPIVACSEELEASAIELAAAKKRQKAKCDAKEAARGSFEKSGAGITRIEAAADLQKKKALCDSEAGTVSTLDATVAQQKAQCEALEPPSETAAEKANASAAAHAEANATDDSSSKEDNEDSTDSIAAQFTGQAAVAEFAEAMTPDIDGMVEDATPDVDGVVDDAKEDIDNNVDDVTDTVENVLTAR